MTDGSNAIESKDVIERAAFRLFAQQGVAATSYTAIAEASGLGRPLVQYHYPKKDDLVVGFVLDLMQSIADVLEKRGGHDPDPMVATLHIGQLYYALLLSTPGMRTLTADILSNRRITNRVISLNARWSLPRTSDGPVASPAFEASVKATGGVYELLSMHLEGEAEALPDPGELAAQHVAAFLAFDRDEPYAQALGRLRARLMGADEVARLVQELTAGLDDR